jgi:hypothetical protein
MLLGAVRNGPTASKDAGTGRILTRGKVSGITPSSLILGVLDILADVFPGQEGAKT